MIIGLLRELKPDERRVALRPVEVRRLVELGHEIVVETQSGVAAGFGDDLYAGAGARIAAAPQVVFQDARLLVKVHEPQQHEPALLKRDHILLASLYCEANRARLNVLLQAGVTAFAVEHVVRPLSASSALGGEIGALEGARLLLAPHSGTGKHFAGHFGLAPARALVIGLGTAGRGALRVLLGLGMSVAGFDIDCLALEQSRLDWPGRDFTALHVDNLPTHLPEADLVVNCVLWDKTRRDHLITRAMLGEMKRGAVIVDVAADRAGAIETSMPTTWLSPVYQVQGITHFCVENLPSASPEAASTGYSRMIFEAVASIAGHGPIEGARRDPTLARGLVCSDGKLLHAGAAQLQGLTLTRLDAL
ncbi:alanine dehydrogenase [Bosea sp. 2YAB26]|uniref:alanine dehydrogenase n=1 Tax=Bosea sp. 2YAB26 TaxID=3237478 RepID=UPI003F917F8F